MENSGLSGFRKTHPRRTSGSRHDVTSAMSSKSRMQALIRELEKEFEALYTENSLLRERVARLEKGGADGSDDRDRAGAVGLSEEPDAFEAMLRTFSKKNAIKTKHKLKAQTSKVLAGFKAPQLTCSLVKEYKGHRDGVWDVAVSNLGHPLVVTASADRTARIWGVDSGRCLLTYVGHAGSVNAVNFHPSQDLVLTASGDGTAHIFKPTLSSSVLSDTMGCGSASAEESPADSSEDDAAPSSVRASSEVRAPIMTLSGHQGVVISCQWMKEGDCAVTASWDRTANLYNVESGMLMQSLTGHDGDLTHVACHPTQQMVVTCSVDSTFRLWDFREAIHSVSVFQGHTDAVTCCVFRSDQIVSGSDDRSVKVWDLRNMRAPVASIQMPSAINRLSVSQTGIIAIPQDNRQVVLYDLSGQKLLRLSRDSSKSHLRMVTSTCWASTECSDQWRSRANLFSAGFDRVAFGWSVRPAAREKEDPAAKARNGARGESTL